MANYLCYDLVKYYTNRMGEQMNFKDILNNYIDVLDCTGKELSEYSGLSAATISRYRSGERVPESGTDNLTNLIQGIVHMAADRRIADITADSVTDSFNRTLQSLSSNISVLHTNLDMLLNTLDISGSEFSKYLNYDSSYVSPLQQIIIEELGQYKEIRDDNNYPDKIRVAFTRDGVFEDSIDVVKYGHIKLSNGEWEPTYIFVAAVGDVWRYDCRGSFIKFYKNHQAHSGQNHTYNP